MEKLKKDIAETWKRHERRRQQRLMEYVKEKDKYNHLERGIIELEKELSNLRG